MGGIAEIGLGSPRRSKKLYRLDLMATLPGRLIDEPPSGGRAGKWGFVLRSRSESRAEITRFVRRGRLRHGGWRGRPIAAAVTDSLVKRGPGA
ncbi:hypothetical protein AAFF_G00428170 [Aldrovandia affinis]|uniref:Uncharacterized protein n=1 Tax=Aldrovandia affinis TaxID=143900 RepID=A0AAD7WIJ7_9TELE|nr:hypothetical protein AAFF_G00428170 [Aldrovandia affinis]